MERNKLRLKEQPSATNASTNRLHSRYTPPKPPSMLERFIAAGKQLGRVVIFTLVAVTAFLFIPLLSWDDYTVWKQMQEALIRLEAHPNSLPDLNRISASANSAMLLWSEPSGARPEKWYQYFQQSHYDECYGIIQVLALGLMKHGNPSRGVNELERLQKRTDKSIVPNLPFAEQAFKICTKCKNGYIQEECHLCRGNGKCLSCEGRGWVTVPSKKPPVSLHDTLSSSRRPDKVLGSDPPIHQNCPNCQQTGKCLTCDGTGKSKVLLICSACGGQQTIIYFKAVTNLFQNAIEGTVSAIDHSMTFRRVVHAGATIQQALLRRSGEIGNSVLAVVHVDPIFENTHPTASALPSSQSNELVPFNDKDSQRAGTDGQGTAVQDPVEARLQRACETLQHTPQSAPDLQILVEVSQSATNKPALRSRAIAAFGLSRLLQGDTNAFTRITQLQKTAYPDIVPLVTITNDDYTATCDGCLGGGTKGMPCPMCMGTNKCKVCNGIGKTAAGEGFVPCEACRYKETCRMCNGQKRKGTICPFCKGTGKICKPNDKVSNNYNLVLSNIVTICQENYAKAQREAASRKPDDHRMAQEQSNLTVLPTIGIFIVSLLLILFIHHRFTRKRKHDFISLPGMDKLDASKYTDPLSLNAEESKARANTKTAEGKTLDG